MSKNLSLGRPIRRSDILASVDNVLPIHLDGMEDVLWCHKCTENGSAGIEPLDETSGVFKNMGKEVGPVWFCLAHVKHQSTFVPAVVAELTQIRRATSSITAIN